MILKEFENAGYYIKYKLLNASDFGVPQKRERVFIVGFRDFDDYSNFSFPVATTLSNSKIKLKKVIDKKQLRVCSGISVWTIACRRCL